MEVHVESVQAPQGSKDTLCNVCRWLLSEALAIQNVLGAVVDRGTFVETIRHQASARDLQDSSEQGCIICKMLATSPFRLEGLHKKTVCCLLRIQDYRLQSQNHPRHAIELNFASRDRNRVCIIQ